jgi:hypothetical protein
LQFEVSKVELDPERVGNFKRVIAFWNVQVMLYNIGYLKNLLNKFFFQGTVPLAVKCFNVAIIMGTFLG